MPRDAPTLPRQNTVEFLGKLMRGNSFEGGHQGEQDVDDGRVGALTRVRGGSTSTLAGGGESETGSPLGGNRPGLRRRMSSSSGFPVDPYPLIEVGAFQQSDVSRRDPYGTAATEAEGEGKGVKTVEPRGVETSVTRAPTRRSARAVSKVVQEAPVVEAAPTRRRRHKSTAAAATSSRGSVSSSVTGFKKAAFGRVNAQHGANDAGDHHGWTYIPKRADRRRAIARFTTALIRAAGHQSFISREGVGYRKAFDRFLLETYGQTFSESGYWYSHAEIEPFFRTILYVATDGKVNIANEDVKYLFTKKEERQAAEWVIDEDVLAYLGVSVNQFAGVYEGESSTSPAGFPRGTPLKVPSSETLPPEPTPFLESYVRGKTGAATAVMPPPPPRAPTPMLPSTTSAGAVPPEIQKLFESIPKPDFQGLSPNKSRRMSRQYSSDLARLMSEFNTDPAQGDEFVRQFLQRSASELDALAAESAEEKKNKDDTAPTARTRRPSKRKRS